MLIAWAGQNNVSLANLSLDGSEYKKFENNTEKNTLFRETFFLPLAGALTPNSGTFTDATAVGYYWSSSPNTLGANILLMTPKDVYIYYDDRGDAFSVRCFKNTPDTTAPVLSWSSPSVNIVKSGTEVMYTLTLTEMNPNDVIITTGDFTIAGSATVKSVTAINASNQYTVVVTAGTTNGAVTLTPKAGIVSDTAGNKNVASPTSASFTVDNTKPTVTITTSKTQTKQGDVVVITGTFSEAVTDSTPKIAMSGVATLAATAMTKVSTTVYKYSYTVPAGNGTQTITISSAQDTAGNTVANTTKDFTIDNTKPT